MVCCIRGLLLIMSHDFPGNGHCYQVTCISCVANFPILTFGIRYENGAKWNEGRSWHELTDALRYYGTSVRTNISFLIRIIRHRISYNVYDIHMYTCLFTYLFIPTYTQYPYILLIRSRRYAHLYVSFSSNFIGNKRIHTRTLSMILHANSAVQSRV